MDFSYPSHSCMRMIHLMDCPFSIKSKALLISENGTVWVMNLSTSSSCNIHKDHVLATWVGNIGSLKRPHNSLCKQAYPTHVLLDNRWKIGAWFVVAIKGALKSPLVQEINRSSFECIIFTRHTNKYSKTPTLRRKKWRFSLSK